MEPLQELENQATVANADVDDDDDTFQDLFQAPVRKTTYLVKLEGPLSTASRIQHLAGMSRLPEQVSGTGDGSGDASFCFINGAQKLALAAALARRLYRSFTPTFIRINRAEEALASDSMEPFLGFDSTLTHNRPADPLRTFLPRQDQYPVWYFFYGTLADPTVLVGKLGFPYPLVYHSATITGGELRIWGGTRKALVDGVGTVRGWAYLVTCAENEEALRHYETDRYEVVRCSITIESTGQTVLGLTFRFIGGSD
ncbi:hypothetical protein ASPCAL07780 [Aspergillus calidoustus]|uniref:Putative gamma-glutamylcyclotransferase n=1 Tax=Aspergillus calidoustus TaxID=454130 RepID=A0A0U5GSR0_ASPCI|nr:hypothetical protein ASPCAL07780 [Aspergillus calidoustus]